MLKSFFKYFLIGFVVFSTTYAQDKPLTSIGDVQFYIDMAGFKGKENKTIQEFYLMMFADQFEVNKINDLQKSEYEINATLKDNFGKTIYSDSWKTEIQITNDSPAVNSIVRDQWNIIVNPGDYILSLKLTDAKTGKQGNVDQTIRIKNYNSDKITTSDLEFISSYSNVGNVQFKKGNIFITPNAWRRFGVLNPILYFYYEVYNLSQFSADSLFIKYTLTNMDGKAVKTFPQTVIKNPKNSESIFNGLNIANMPSGIYELAVEINSSNSVQLKSLSRQFEIIQPDYLDLVSRSNDEFEISNNIIKFLTTPFEYDKYLALTDNAKTEYLKNFWKEKDSNKYTKENEYYLNILQRYNYANKNFSWGNIEGWKSDRGRVIIQYGMPADIQRHFFETNIAPYEEWIYREDREFKFVFCDLRSDGRFVLLHSTKEGELYNLDWVTQARI